MNISPAHKDPSLLLRIAAGDTQAFRVLFDQYFDLVFSTALRFTAVRHLAEDAAQQVFMKIWETRSELSKVEKIEPYLFTAAKHEMFQHFRRQAHQRDYVLHVLDVFSEARSLDPESIYISQEQVNQLQHIIDHLPARQREAFLLSRDAELTYQQIAQRMGISKETVREHIAQALKTLREHTQQYPSVLAAVIVYLLG
jgi:RNA polymerase sigma-70 factor (family 1)